MAGPEALYVIGTRPEANALVVGTAAELGGQRLAASREDPLLSVSIGMAVYPEDGQTVEALVQAADAGLYDMKHRRKPLPQAAPQPSPALDQMAQWAQYLVEIKDMERRLRRTS